MRLGSRTDQECVHRPFWFPTKEARKKLSDNGLSVNGSNGWRRLTGNVGKIYINASSLSLMFVRWPLFYIESSTEQCVGWTMFS
jgi:hypothetical protein